MQTPPHTPSPPEHRETSPTFGDMVWAIADLAGGAVVTLLPLLLLSVPSIVLFLVLPALVLLAVAAIPVVVAGAILVPMYLLTRRLLRVAGTRRTPAKPAGSAARGEWIASGLSRSDRAGRGRGDRPAQAERRDRRGAVHEPRHRQGAPHAGYR